MTNLIIVLCLLMLTMIIKPDIILFALKEIFALLNKLVDIFKGIINIVLTKIVDEYLEKLSSGRYFILVAIISTVCIVTIYSLMLLDNGRISVEVFLGIFALASSIASGITAYYFGQSSIAKDQAINTTNNLK